MILVRYGASVLRSNGEKMEIQDRFRGHLNIYSSIIKGRVNLIGESYMRAFVVVCRFPSGFTLQNYSPYAIDFAMDYSFYLAFDYTRPELEIPDLI